MVAKRLILLAALLLAAQCLAQDTPASPPAAPEAEEAASEAAEPEAAEGAEELDESEQVEEAEPPLPPPPPPPPPSPPQLPTPAATPAASPAPPTSTPGSASVQFMITAEMKSKLLALGYSEADVEQLQPERARIIVDKGLKRASTLPASWTKSAKRDGPVVQAWKRVKKVGQTPAGAAGLAASALATVAVAALSSRGPGDFALASRPKVAKAARLQPVKVKAQKAEAPPAVESDAPAKKLSYNPDDLWLDQQIDKFIAFLAGLFGRR